MKTLIKQISSFSIISILTLNALSSISVQSLAVGGHAVRAKVEELRSARKAANPEGSPRRGPKGLTPTDKNLEYGLNNAAAIRSGVDGANGVMKTWMDQMDAMIASANAKASANAAASSESETPSGLYAE